MTHDHPTYALTACELGHAHFKVQNQAGRTVCLMKLTARQAHNLAEELHEVANRAEVILANVPGIVGGDAEACL